MATHSDDERTLREYARVVARRRWVLAFTVLTTVATALGVASMQDPIYEAEAQMLVKTRGTDAIFDSSSASGGNELRAIGTEIQVLQSQVVSERVADNLGLDQGAPAARGSTLGATDVVAVRVQSGDPSTAQVLANAYVDAYIEVKREQAVETLLSAGSELQKKITELQAQIDLLDAAGAADSDAASDSLAASQRRVLVDQQALFKQRLDQLQVDAALATGGAQVVREAELPIAPIAPTPLRTAVLALIVGLILGLGAAFLLEYLDDSIRSSDEMEQATGGLPVLAVVPVDPPPDNRPISLSRPGDYAVESYRGLRTGLQFLSLEKEARVIQVTSPLSAEGKTTTAANLAVVFAQAGHRVVLVDSDLRRPRIHQLFTLDPARGLTDALLGEPFQLLVHNVIDNLDVLPSGSIPPNPSELLGGRQMREVINDLGDDYELVIIDSAPILPVTDSVALAALVEGVVLVTQAGRTSRRQIRQALDSLERVQAPILGAVLNRVGSRGRRGQGYGYGYGSYGSDPGLGAGPKALANRVDSPRLPADASAD